MKVVQSILNVVGGWGMSWKRKSGHLVVTVMMVAEVPLSGEEQGMEGGDGVGMANLEAGAEAG